MASAKINPQKSNLQKINLLKVYVQFLQTVLRGTINYVIIRKSTQMPNGRSGFDSQCSRFIKVWYMHLLTLNHHLQYAKRLFNIIARCIGRLLEF